MDGIAPFVKTIRVIHANQLVCPANGLPIHRQPDWLYVSDQYAYTTGIIADVLITSRAAGYADIPGALQYCRILEGIFESKPTEDHQYVILEDYSGVKGAEKDARKIYIDFFTKQQQHVKGILFFNTTFQMNLSVRLGKALNLVQFNIELLDSYDAAVKRAGELLDFDFFNFDTQPAQGLSETLELVSQDRSGAAGQSAIDIPPIEGKKMQSHHNTTEAYVQELMQFISGIKWDQKGIRRKDTVDQSHPFLPVMDAISLIKDDLDDLLNSRKAVENSLRESEEKYRRILEEINDAFFELDLKGDITLCNRAFSSLVGYEEDNIIGLNYREYVNPDNIPHTIEMFTRVYETGKPEKVVDYVLNRKNGQALHVETSVSLKRDRQGQPVGFRGIVRDVSHSKKIENELIRHRDHLEELVQEQTRKINRSKAGLKKILDSMPDAVLIVGMDKVIRYANQTATELMGYDSKEAVQGLECHKTLCCPREENQCPIIDLGIKIDRAERTLQTKDGRRLPILKSAIRIVLDDELVLLVTFVDITERKRAEEELRRSKIAAEAANMAKSEFLANMSHEIRTPLNGIIGMSELAMETPLQEDQRNIISTIENESNHLLGIINNVLDFSKIEAGKFELDEMAFDLRLMIEDVAGSIAMRARNNGLEFASHIAPDVPSRLVGDPGRLRQVLNNLAGNALKFTSEGEIIIRVRTIAESDSGVTVRFVVSDTGIGIPKDRQAVIFESFTQADGSTTRQYGGTGLGTTIAKQLIEMMGGQIGLVSREGEGTTFWFTAQFAKAADIDKANPCEEDISGFKVLVVDDNDAVLEILVEYVNRFGCEVHTAVDGHEALAELMNAASKSKAFDLILSDIMMPGMDGYALAKAVRSSMSLKDTPIILLTGAGNIGDGEKCRQLGVGGYLHKPVKIGELFETIKLVLESDPAETQTLPELVTRHTLRENLKAQGRILLVEDYPTNQQVALRHLQSAGYTVDLAENGREAVDAVEARDYRLVLMDMQMPVMDGYEATKRIRECEFKVQEKSSDHSTNRSPMPITDHRLPIIAMTAHAMKGEREKCIQAGVDDYLHKPMKKEDLLSMVDKWLNKGPSKVLTPKATAALEPREVRKEPLDFDRAIQEFENDREFLMDVLFGFLDNVRRQISTMRRALDEGDAQIVAAECHSIKGGAGNLTAEDLSNAAKALETIGRSGNLTEGRNALDVLENEYRRLAAYAETLNLN